VSSKRKLLRAQGKSGVRTPPEKSRGELRKERAEERFAKPGSAELWTALLGWEPARVERIWVVQRAHDAARRRERGEPTDLAAISEKVGPEDAERAIELWLASGDEYAPADPAPKWHYLAALAQRSGLGETTPEALQEDWEVWTGMRLAAPARAALMNALGQSEQAAALLEKLTASPNASAIVNLLRLAWSALAYGDARAFERLRGWSNEWLASSSKK
jgi:hypothetical protein